MRPTSPRSAGFRLCVPVAALALLGLVGCETTPVGDTYDLAEGAPIRLDNPAGNVTLSTWDEPGVRVVARGSGARPRDGEASSVSITSDSGGLLITTTPDAAGEARKVDFEITAPAFTSFEGLSMGDGTLTLESFEGSASGTVNGPVRGDEIRGPVNLTAVDGDIDVSFDQFPYFGDVILTSTEGSVLVFVPRDTHAALQIVAREGQIIGTDNLSAGRQLDESEGQTTVGRLGDGGPSRLLITAGKGDVVFRKPPTWPLTRGLTDIQMVDLPDHH